jgi:hypothetical protein
LISQLSLAYVGLKIKRRVCLSNSYYNKRSQLSWNFSKKHLWLAKISGVKRSTWYPHCFHVSERLGIKNMQKLAH